MRHEFNLEVTGWGAFAEEIVRALGEGRSSPLLGLIEGLGLRHRLWSEVALAGGRLEPRPGVEVDDDDGDLWIEAVAVYDQFVPDDVSLESSQFCLLTAPEGVDEGDRLLFVKTITYCERWNNKLIKPIEPLTAAEAQRRDQAKELYTGVIGERRYDVNTAPRSRWSFLPVANRNR